MQVFLIILGIVWSILCLVLFFKVWGACNNIAEIKKHICNNPTNANETNLPKQNTSSQPQQQDTETQTVVYTESGENPTWVKILIGVIFLFFLVLIIFLSTQ